MTPTYAEILRDTYGVSEIWPLVDITSGTTINAFISAARDGVLTGWDLQNAAGPVPGTLAPFSDGANDKGNILTTSLNNIFDGAEGSLFAWHKVLNAGVWTDSTYREGVRFQVDGSNYIIIRKTNSPSGQLSFLHNAGGSSTSVTHAFSSTDDFSFGMSWSKSANEKKHFVNGVQVGATQSYLGVWAGTLVTALIGAGEATPSEVWHGWLSYIAVRFGSIWTPTQFQEIHDAAATAGPDF